jgi:NADH-quinone oxidoreductase subunit J
MIQTLNQIIFWLFVVITVASAGVVVFSKRVIYSAFALLFTFFGVAGLYLFLAADFLAASQVLIYVGGILTLIIFGVFLTARISTMDIPQQTHQRYLALIPVVGMMVVLIYGLFTTDWAAVTPSVEPTTKSLGVLLLTTYLVPFEVASILLLAALIGAMRLARPPSRTTTGNPAEAAMPSPAGAAIREEYHD